MVTAHTATAVLPRRYSNAALEEVCTVCYGQTEDAFEENCFFFFLLLRKDIKRISRYIFILLSEHRITHVIPGGKNSTVVRCCTTLVIECIRKDV